jgi:hypothetical protein
LWNARHGQFCLLAHLAGVTWPASDWGAGKETLVEIEAVAYLGRK